MDVQEERLDRKYTWYCITCKDSSMYSQTTNTTAIRHIERNPTHEVIGIGTMVSKFTADKPPAIPEDMWPETEEKR